VRRADRALAKVEGVEIASIGFVLPPAMGEVMMSLSTVIVAINALTLRRLDLRTGVSEPTAHPVGSVTYPAGT